MLPKIKENNIYLSGHNFTIPDNYVLLRDVHISQIFPSLTKPIAEEPVCTL